MQKKHPPPAQPSSFQTLDDTPQLSFPEEQVLNAIKSFRMGSAPGPDRLRAEHLEVALKLTPPNRQDKAGEAITGLVNTLSNGAVPSIVARFLCGARLHAGLKKIVASLRHQLEISLDDWHLSVLVMQYNLELLVISVLVSWELLLELAWRL